MAEARQTEALEELQMRFSFQEDALQQMSAELARQQRDIDQLRQQMRALEEALRSMPEKIAQERPPHY